MSNTNMLNAKVVGHRMREDYTHEQVREYMEVTLELGAHAEAGTSKRSVSKVHVPVEVARKEYPIGSYHHNFTRLYQGRLELDTETPEPAATEKAAKPNGKAKGAEQLDALGGSGKATSAPRRGSRKASRSALVGGTGASH